MILKNQLIILPLFVTLIAVSSDRGLAQTLPSVRSIEARFTTNTIVPDGVISPGEWDGIAAGGDQWRVLREPNAPLDADNHRFGLLWDDNNLYILYESDFNGFEPLLFGGPPIINFNSPNIGFYLDPNRDGDLNFDADTGELADVNNPVDTVDGYQFSFNTPDGNFCFNRPRPRGRRLLYRGACEHAVWRSGRLEQWTGSS